MPIGSGFCSAYTDFLIYFPEEILPSTGFSASSGIFQLFPSFTAPEIFPFLHKSAIVCSATPHSEDNCLHVFMLINSTTLYLYTLYRMLCEIISDISNKFGFSLFNCLNYPLQAQASASYLHTKKQETPSLLY